MLVAYESALLVSVAAESSLEAAESSLEELAPGVHWMEFFYLKVETPAEPEMMSHCFSHESRIGLLLSPKRCYASAPVHWLLMLA